MSQGITIKMKNIRSRFVALDVTDKSRVVAEGNTALSVAKKAKKTGKPFTMMFVPAAGTRYIF